MAIAYLKHPESHITQISLNATNVMNITIENVERDANINKVIQKASLSKFNLEEYFDLQHFRMMQKK